MDAGFNKILIVEDDLSQKALWNHVVARMRTGATIEWGVSAEQAKKLIHQSQKSNAPFDLIIVDLFLAGSDTGLDFLKSKEVLSQKAKTILVSAADQFSLESHLKNQLGQTKLITKPLSLAKCERIIRELLDSKEFVDGYSI